MHRDIHDPPGIYPAPEMYRLDPVRGMKLIVPVALESYERGWNPMVQDVYEVETVQHDERYFTNQWLFKERVRIYCKPLHYELLTGKPYRCKACEAYWKECPERPDEVMIERIGEFHSWDIQYKIKPFMRL